MADKKASALHTLARHLMGRSACARISGGKPFPVAVGKLARRKVASWLGQMVCHRLFPAYTAFLRGGGFAGRRCGSNAETGHSPLLALIRLNSPFLGRRGKAPNSREAPNPKLQRESGSL